MYHSDRDVFIKSQLRQTHLCFSFVMVQVFQLNTFLIFIHASDFFLLRRQQPECHSVKSHVLPMETFPTRKSVYFINSDLNRRVSFSEIRDMEQDIIEQARLPISTESLNFKNGTLDKHTLKKETVKFKSDPSIRYSDQDGNCINRESTCIDQDTKFIDGNEQFLDYGDTPLASCESIRAAFACAADGVNSDGSPVPAGNRKQSGGS